jgi:calcineurin-like phosphoesterase family protein
LCGNHDINKRNGLSTKNHQIVLKVKNVLIQLIHDPKDADIEYPIILHAHVHNEFKFREMKYKRKSSLLINCGVDVNDFTPVSLSDILNIYYNEWLKVENDNKKKKERNEEK